MVIIFKKISTLKFSIFDFEIAKIRSGAGAPRPQVSSVVGGSVRRPPILFLQQSHKLITNTQKCSVLGTEFIFLLLPAWLIMHKSLDHSVLPVLDVEKVFSVTDRYRTYCY